MFRPEGTMNYPYVQSGSLGRSVSNLLDAQHLVGFFEGALLYEITFTTSGGGWRARLKAYKGETFLVAFHSRGSLTDLIEDVGALLEHGDLRFFRDKYPNRSLVLSVLSDS